MKKLLVILLVMLFTVPALAQPSYLKDAKIKVTLKNGQTYEFSANKYKVVKRENKTSRQKKSRIKHSIGLLGGYSQSRLDVNVNNTTVTSQTKNEPVVGLEYRMTIDGYFGEIVILNNDTALIGVGKEF